MQPLKAALPNCVNNDVLVQIKSVIKILSRNIESTILVTESGMSAKVVPLTLSITPAITLFEMS